MGSSLFYFAVVVDLKVNRKNTLILFHSSIYSMMPTLSHIANMKPGPLDMGYARSLESTLSVVVRTNPSPLDFQFAADTLVSQWPVLNLRMDPMVRSLSLGKKKTL
jgi:hypothetical protein